MAAEYGTTSLARALLRDSPPVRGGPEVSYEFSKRNLFYGTQEAYKYSPVLAMLNQSNIVARRSTINFSLSPTMLFKFALVSSLAVLAVATPTPQSNQCNTGPIQCCDSVQSADSPAAAALAGALGIVLQDVTAQVGLTCVPILVSRHCVTMVTSQLMVFDYVHCRSAASGATHALLSPCAVKTTASVSLSLREALLSRVTDNFASDGVIAIGCSPINLI